MAKSASVHILLGRRVIEKDKMASLDVILRAESRGFSQTFLMIVTVDLDTCGSIIHSKEAR